MGEHLVQRFITEEFKASVSEVLDSALVGKETANFEFPMFTKFGERRDILLNATTRRGPNDEVTGVIGVGQDITQIRKITKEQERVADDLSRLIESAMPRYLVLIRMAWSLNGIRRQLRSQATRSKNYG